MIANVGKIEGPRFQHEEIDVTCRPWVELDYDPRVRAGMLVKATLPWEEERLYTIVELSAPTPERMRLVLQEYKPDGRTS